jgi:hypothetical protein
LSGTPILVPDVPPVLAQMRGDPIGPGGNGQLRRAHRIWHKTAPRVSNRRDMIDVHAKAWN